MTETKLFKALKNGIASFTYTKVDGSIRHAQGTINADFITDASNPSYVKKLYNTKDPKFVTNITNNGYITYYDVNKKEIRCFDPKEAKLA